MAVLPSFNLLRYRLGRSRAFTRPYGPIFPACCTPLIAPVNVPVSPYADLCGLIPLREVHMADQGRPASTTSLH